MTVTTWLLTGILGGTLAAGAFLVVGPSDDPSRDDFVSRADRARPIGATQVESVAAVHRNGQTFVTWREIDPPPAETLTVRQLTTLADALAKKRIRYRVYRSAAPITRLSAADLVGEVHPLSAWNRDHYGIYPRPDTNVRRYVIEEGQPPLPAGTGLFVYKAPRNERAYYAVTVSLAGVESSAVTAGNSADVIESVGAAPPVLQHVDTPKLFFYVQNATLRYYVRWETADNSAIAGKPFDYLVAVPPKVTYPATIGLHLHAWGGSMVEGFGWWFATTGGRAILVSANQVPYDWWTGYHERFWSHAPGARESWAQGVVRPYTQRRLLSFVDWLSSTMDVDRTRLFAAGNSMGGSGAIMLAIREPSRVAWAVSWVGVHVPAGSPGFRSSYEGVYGPRDWDVKFEDGTPVWDHFDDVWYLRQHPDRDVGFITFSNGKNDGAIGWRQAVQFLRALQDTRQPHLFVWGQNGHGQRAVMPPGGNEGRMPLDIRTDRSLPAFSNGSLDDDPGGGDPADGDASGQVNAFLTWQPESIVDEPDQWSIVIQVASQAPGPEGVVDVTPRRLQQFKPKPGQSFAWTATSDRNAAQRGTVSADKWGVVTIPQVVVTREGTRLTIRPGT